MIMQGDLKKIQDSINPVLGALGDRIKKLEKEIEALKSAPKASKGG
jgi:hypothetical protein